MSGPANSIDSFSGPTIQRFSDLTVQRLAGQRFDVIVIFFRDLGLLLIALVQIKAVAESDAFACGHNKIPRRLVGQLLEIMLAEGVGGKQAVIPDMPPGGMTWVFGMIENGNTDGLALHRTVIIAPG